jgi:uncharacterized membrane protein YkvA (DUF1232 family)
MGQEQLPAPVPPEQTNAVIRWLGDVIRQGRLAWRLFWDRRVPFLAKLIPPAALAYILFPVDILPDVALGLGQLDDIAVLLIGLKLFIEVAPPDVVREHLIALGARIGEWRVKDEEKSGPPAVVEGDYVIVEAEADETAEEEESDIAEGELADEEETV